MTNRMNAAEVGGMDATTIFVATKETPHIIATVSARKTDNLLFIESIYRTGVLCQQDCM